MIPGGRVGPIAAARSKADPYSAYVVSGAHFNGSWADVVGGSIGTSGAPSNSGTAKYGSGAASVSPSNYIYKTLASAIGTQDFTLEFWIQVSSTQAGKQLLSSGEGAGTFQLYSNSSSQISYYKENNAFLIANAFTLPTASYQHIAVERYLGTTKIYLNGASQGSAADSTNYSVTTIGIGCEPGGNLAITALYDDWRATVGSARYRGNFTPSASEFVYP